jgi:DNA-binding SARP family transcriptional activator/tetratricopeptide (TPR) repeat protein
VTFVLAKIRIRCHFGLMSRSDEILTASTTFRVNYEEEPVVVLRALGKAEIETDSATLTPSQEVVFAAALYLILENGKHVRRTRLASLLWPQVPDQARSHRLRQTILQLKKLGIVVTADRDTLRLSSDVVENDTQTLSTPNVADLLERESLEFLPGYSPRLSESLRDWIDAKRSEVHALATSVLVRDLERSRLKGDWRTVEKTAAKCLALDPYNEVAVLAQAEASAMRGGKRQAVSILDRYIAEVGGRQADIRLPATLLRRRVLERVPDRPALLHPDPPFVGREAETEILTRRFAQARSGKGSAVLVVGEPGIGKTRLSSEVARFAELQGAQVQRTSCRRTDVDRPLSLFVDIVPLLREMPGALGCAPESFASLTRLTEFEDRPSETSRQADSDMVFQSLRTALFDLFESVTDERCLLLLIEDVQWLDEASSRILIRMVERCASQRLFFLLNARPSNTHFLDYADKARLETVTLAPLAPAACTVLLQSIALVPSDAITQDVIRWCLSVAEGNPFFLQELAHQWIETGKRHDAPPSVTKVLQERLSRLSPDALQVLQTCAILGEHATLDRIERVLEYPPHQLLSAVEALSKAAMLTTNPDRTECPDGQLQPRHDFLASAATGRLAPVSLSFLHRRSADVLEKDITREKMPTTLLWACASHRHLGGDRERALSLSASCAEHLLEVGLVAEARAGFERSLEYCVSDAQRLTLLPRLAHSLELEGEWEKSKQVLRTAIQLFAKQDSSQSRHNDFELLLLDSRYRSALDFVPLLKDTIACVEDDTGSAEHRVGAGIMAMKIAVDFGRRDCVQTVYERVYPLLVRSEISEETALEVQIIYRTECGDGLVPFEDLEHFVEVARSTGKEQRYSHALLMAIAACRRSGRYKEGLLFAARATEHARLHKLTSQGFEIMNSIVLLHIAANEFGKAKETFRDFGMYGLPSENAKVRNEIYCIDARIALEDGDLAQAIAAFESIERGSPTISVTRRGYHLALEVQILLQQRAVGEVLTPILTELEETHRQMRTMGSQDFEAHTLYLGLCELGQRRRAAELIRAYATDYRKSKWPLPATILNALADNCTELPSLSPTKKARSEKSKTPMS